MQFTFLGTSSGVPTRHRNVSALAIRHQDKHPWVLVDCGEGTQHQLLDAPYARKYLQAICITHVHGDHCFGLPGLLASLGMGGRKEPLIIIGPQPLKEFIDTALRVSVSYIDYPIEFVAVETLDPTFHCAGFSLRAWPLSHRVPSYAYAFTEVVHERQLDPQKLEAAGIEKGPLWGQIQRGEDVMVNGRAINTDDYCLPGRPPRRVIVAGDNDTPSLLEEPAREANVLVHEATYTQEIADKVGAGRGHSSAKVVAEFAEAVKLPNLVLTHFSARYSEEEAEKASVDLLKQEAAESYGGQVFLAADLRTYRLNKAGVLKLDTSA